MRFENGHSQRLKGDKHRDGETKIGLAANEKLLSVSETSKCL